MNSLPGEPMITTIMPTYRRPKLLRKAIISVLNQTYPHFQVCVYDNASGDETHDIVAEIAREDPRVKYHCHSENIGGIANFNYGMKKVTSPFFSLLSDDNTLLPQFFEDAISSLNQYPEAVLYAGQTVGIYEKSGKRNYKNPQDEWDAGLVFPLDGLLNIIEKDLPASIDGVLFRREVLDSVGVFDPSFNGAIDQDYMMRIARNHIFYVSKNHGVLFLHHDDNWTSKRDLEEMITTRKKILERWYNDEGLPWDIRQRIKKSYKLYVKNVIPSVVFMKCIVGDDRATLSTARKMMKEVGVSFKPLRAIIIAELANRSHFLKKIIIRILRKMAS